MMYLWGDTLSIETTTSSQATVKHWYMYHMLQISAYNTGGLFMIALLLKGSLLLQTKHTNC